MPAPDGEHATATGTICGVLTTLTRQDNLWARVTLIPDGKPPLTIAVFPELYRDAGHLLIPGRPLTAHGRATRNYGAHLLAETLTA
jgi:hypothetical protein